MGFKEKIRKIWSRKLYRRLFLWSVSSTIVVTGITVACISTVIKYSVVESVHIIPPQEVITIRPADKNQSEYGVLVIRGTEALEWGKLQDPFSPKINFKNFNGATDPEDLIEEGNMTFSYEKYDASLPWWLGITDSGLLTWSLERGVDDIQINVYVLCSIKPHGFNEWYDSVPFLLKITLIGVNL